MRVTEAIHARRAVREYVPGPLSESIVRDLIDAAVQAPTGMLLEPWSFVVVQDQELLKKISDRAIEIIQEHGISPELQAMFARPEWNIFYNAGTLIIICAKPIGEHPDWDCCLAAENLMLAARDLGLGSCVIGFSWSALKQPDIKSLLGIPEAYQAIMPIIVGHPKQFPPSTGRKSPEILSWKVAAHV
jgi:nitroreductase